MYILEISIETRGGIERKVRFDMKHPASEAKKIELLGLKTIPEIQLGDDLPDIISKCAADEIGGLFDKDVVVITSKIVSKSLGLLLKLDDIKPCPKALMISEKTGKDARWIQAIFDLEHEILAIIPLDGVLKEHIMNSSQDAASAEQVWDFEKAVCVTKSKNGRIHTCDAGLDMSNHPVGLLSYLPEDPDKVAADIRAKIQKLTGKQVAVILADTEIVPIGTMDLAIGSAGIAVRTKEFANPDRFGNPKFGGMDIVVNELASAVALVWGQTNAGVPVVIVRGYDYAASETENISRTLYPADRQGDFMKLIKETMLATSYAKGPRTKLILRNLLRFI